MITEVYAEFSMQTRKNECTAYLQTLTGMVSNRYLSLLLMTTCGFSGRCLSADATFKLAKKACIVDTDHTFNSLLKGGLLSAINEDQEIVTFMRSKIDSVGYVLMALN